MSKKEYPFNIICQVLEYRTGGKSPLEIDTSLINKDMINGLKFAISNLKEDEKEVLKLKFECGLTHKIIRYKMDITEYKLDKLVTQALRRLRSREYKKYIEYGLAFTRQSEEVEDRRLSRISERLKNNDLEISLCTLTDINAWTFTKLKDAGIRTIRELVEYTEKNKANWHRQIDNFCISDKLECEKLIEKYAKTEEDWHANLAHFVSGLSGERRRV